VAYHRAARRDVAREAAPARAGSADLSEQVDREPTPDEAAVLTETVEQLFAALDEDERPVLDSACRASVFIDRLPIS
jgi:hypothetical protein